MKIIVHRGTHQIGGIIIELAAKNTRIIVDIGQALPNATEISSSVPLQYPQVKGLFTNDISKIDGVLVSHGHGDHIGLIPYLKENVPVYAGKKTADIYNMIGRFLGRKSSVIPSTILEHEKIICIGDFIIIPYLIDHSAYDSYAFVIYGEDQCVVYTGDIREHGKKAALTRYFRNKLPKKVDVLLMEGTMLGRVEERIETEEELRKQAAAIMSQTKKPVFVLQSSTNIDRLVGMYRAARDSGRTFIIDIFTANILDTIGGSVSHILRKARIVYPNPMTDRMIHVYNERELMYKFANRKITLHELATMQNYCMLIRISMLSMLKNLGGIEGAEFIYSLWKGYGERADVRGMLSFAEQKNMEIKYLHTSGHGEYRTLQRIAESCRPQKVIPIHTEQPEKYKELFKNVYRIQDGEVLTV